MKGVDRDDAIEEVALRSLLAGSDWLQGPRSSDDVAAILDRFEQAVRRGELTSECVASWR